ncbi:thioredoxin domain [Vibrio phage VB_VaC_TDDLMA]
MSEMSQNELKFTNETINSATNVLVAVKATWCGPCQTLTPILEELQSEGHPIYLLDADENGDFVGMNAIRSVPTMIVFRNGQEVTRTSGLKTKEEIVQLLNKE